MIFCGCQRNFLKSFITVRNMKYQKVSKLPNKRNMVDALGGQSNMICIAYHSRDIYNYMKEKIATMLRSSMIMLTRKQYWYKSLEYKISIRRNNMYIISNS